ncbi:MAG: HAD family hydrolase [Ruminococcaceae bacterium]|nr:HAD family hydrolase [Oscillospiraceae bacterium]
MKTTTLLFDLDGTLLPLDQDEFIIEYFRLIAEYLTKRKPDADKYINAVKQAVFGMMKNDGSCTNEELFAMLYKEKPGKDEAPESLFEAFYKNDFEKLKKVCGYAPEAKKAIELAKEKGLRLILATNPAFPSVATYDRIRWAGLVPEDFEHITAWENSSFCKPEPGYYREIFKKCIICPSECMMIGNDTLDDMLPSKALGMKYFLLTNCLVNRTGRDINEFPHGGWKELFDVISKL